jgi:hypothetical protein
VPYALQTEVKDVATEDVGGVPLTYRDVVVTLDAGALHQTLRTRIYP